MVKVYKCHNFKSQSVVQVEGEPIAFYISRENLFVATNECTIEVFSLKSPITKISCFSTESTVHDIVYCYPGNYVATVESKNSRKKDFYSVKVYLNWGIATSKSKQKTSVRLAGKDQSVKLSNIEESHIQVIDIPFKDTVQSLDVCQKTGNLIAVSRDYTFIYHLVEKTIQNSDRSYQDIELFLQLEWHIGKIEKAVICEDIIGVLSRKEVQLVKVIYSDENLGRFHNLPVEVDRLSTSGKGFGNQHRKPSSVISTVSSSSSFSLQDTAQFSKIGSTANSPSLSLTKSFESLNPIKEDEHFIKISLADLKGNQGQNSNKAIKTIHLKNLGDNSADKSTEPIVFDLRGGGHQTAGQIQVITVHHQRSKKMNDDWIHLQLVPTYMTSISRTSSRAAPLRSVLYSSLVGLGCFVSSNSNGYLYDIWSSPPTQLSVYTYSDIPKQIIMNQDLLYVLTGRGLEIYTSRCGAAAIHHTGRFNTKEKMFPPANMETCLCGVHLFMNTVKLDVSEKFVIVLSKTDGSQRSDTLYAIEKCTPAELYKDMVTYGEKSRSTNEATYFNLLLEGHMTLRTSFIGVDIPDEETQMLFKDSCQRIGEYYSRENSKECQLCIPYLIMSEESVADIIKQLDMKIDNQEYGQGFIAYLKYVLLQDGEPFDLTKADGDIILTICSKAIPDHLSEVILFSRIKDYSSDHALVLLQTWIKELSTNGEKSSVTDKVALSYLHLTLCDPEAAESALSMISKADLLKLCVDHHQLLHDNFQQLSPMSQLMRRCCPSILTQSLVALHDKGPVSLDLAIQLLQGTNSSDEIYRNTHVKEYLELLLNDVKRRYIFDEAVVILSEIYIKRLLDQKSFISKQRTAQQVLLLPTDEGHFGRRYNWLDYLPPFNGPVEMKQPCQYILRNNPTTLRTKASSVKQHMISTDYCHCVLCYEDLIKLQSLLCFKYASDLFFHKVMELLSTSCLVPGHDSLLALVLLGTDKQRATSLIVQKYPGIITDYGKSMMSSDDKQRKLLLDTLFQSLTIQKNKPDDREQVYLQTLHDLLQFFARTTEPQAYLNLLPDNGNLAYFLPYICINLEFKKSQKLLQTVKDTRFD